MRLRLRIWSCTIYTNIVFSRLPPFVKGVSSTATVSTYDWNVCAPYPLNQPSPDDEKVNQRRTRFSGRSEVRSKETPEGGKKMSCNWNYTYNLAQK